MMKLLRVAAALTSIAGLVGCDAIYGIDAGKVVETSPDDQCIEVSLKSTPGVTDVRTDIRTEEGWLIAGPGPRHGTPIKYFSYNFGSDYWPSLTISDNGPGKYLVTNSMLSINKPIPKADMDKALPIMVDAESRIARACGIPLDTAMPHQCDGSACGPSTP